MQPQQESGIEPRVLHQLVGRKDVDDAAAVAVGAHHVFELECRFAEEFGATLVFQHQKLALHRTDRRRRNVAVLRADLFCILGQVREKLAQILEIDQSLVLGVARPEFIVRETERDIDDAFLHIVEIEHPRDQQRTHLENGRADRMTLLAEQVPEHDREFVSLIFDADIRCALDQEVLGFAGLGDTRQVAFDIGGKYRDAGAGETFRQHLQRHGLSGAGRTGDKSMAVGKLEREIFRLLALADEDLVIPEYASHRFTR